MSVSRPIPDEEMVTLRADVPSQTASAARETRVSRVESDPHRPGFHFVPPGGWLNDPNGVGERDGIYHLFYQYNPHAAVHDRIHWGHAVSRDLVRWHDEPVALVPGPDGPDADGCWSGVLVDDDDTPTLVYSGHRHGSLDVMCLARGSADLREWRKDPTNPLLRAPDWLDLIAFRDHCVWRENGRWRQLIGAGIRGVGGSALLFESDDLRAWRFLGPLAVGDLSGGGPVGQPPATAEWTGAVWECIDFFRLAPDGTSGPPGAGSESAGVDVLLFSAWAGDTFHALCLTGTYTATPSRRPACTGSISAKEPATPRSPSPTPPAGVWSSAGFRRSARRSTTWPPAGPAQSRCRG